MPNRFLRNMTKEMLQQVPSQNFLLNEIILCHVHAHLANKAADFQLPANNENGVPISNGNRNYLDSVKEYWIARRDVSVRMYLHLHGEDDYKLGQNVIETYGISSGALGKLGKWNDYVELWYSANKQQLDLYDFYGRSDQPPTTGS